MTHRIKLINPRYQITERDMNRLMRLPYIGCKTRPSTLLELLLRVIEVTRQKKTDGYFVLDMLRPAFPTTNRINLLKRIRDGVNCGVFSDVHEGQWMLADHRKPMPK